MDSTQQHLSAHQSQHQPLSFLLIYFSFLRNGATPSRCLTAGQLPPSGTTRMPDAGEAAPQFKVVINHLEGDAPRSFPSLV